MKRRTGIGVASLCIVAMGLIFAWSGRETAAVAACPPSAGAGDGGAAGPAGMGDAGAGPIAGPPAGPVMPIPHNGYILVHVENKCSFPLYIHTEGGGGGLNPADFMLAAGAVQDARPPDWPTGWVMAYADAAHQILLEKAEMTLVRGTIWYHLGYVDGIALPIEIAALGGGADCGKRIGCYVAQKQIMSSCPDNLLVGQRCVAPATYCTDPSNQAKPYCHSLDAKIAECAQKPQCAAASGATTAQAYDCDRFFGTSYKWCAAINRGMLDNPDGVDPSLFYKKAPYNTYAAWLHSLCSVYAFPYDDYGDTADDNMHACRNGTQINVSFCPAG